MSDIQVINPQDRNPLVSYALKNMWGNPELDQQYQINIPRLSNSLGDIVNFSYMGKYRDCPTDDGFYIIHTLGGLNPNFWNIGGRQDKWNPYDSWISAAEISRRRGVVLDFYNSQGELYPRTQVWLMECFDGITFVAFRKTKSYPLPFDKKMFLRVYTSDMDFNYTIPNTTDKLKFDYLGVNYSSPSDMRELKAAKEKWKSSGYGVVITTHNGILKALDDVKPELGDLIEVFHDPTVYKVLRFSYSNMPDYYSDLDEKRKLLLFVNNLSKPLVYNYFDDCDFYVYNKRTREGLYYHRNNVDSIRQLTHQDYALVAQYVDFLISKLINRDKSNLSTVKDIEIIVDYRKTKWSFILGPGTSRIKDLYLLEDASQIVNAMLDTHSLIPEWRANNLERSIQNVVLDSRIDQINHINVREALGYNGTAIAVSNGPLYMPYYTPDLPEYNPKYPTEPFTTGLGYVIPPTYSIGTNTAYEYGEDGLFLRKVTIVNQHYYKPKTGCCFVEFVMGEGTTWLDYVISKNDVELKRDHGFRVYMAEWVNTDDSGSGEEGYWDNEWSISKDGKVIQPNPVEREIEMYPNGNNTGPNGEGVITTPGGYIKGPWVDITDDETLWEFYNGWVIWKFNKENHIGLVVFDSKHLYDEFTISHIDHSLSFTVNHKWTTGNIQLPIEPAQIDLIMNNHPLIEGVDYVKDYPRFHVFNKMWLNENNTNKFIIIGRGLSPNGSIPSSELGFIGDGVIGYNGRYNLRIDRPTKTICDGRLWLTKYIDSAEDINHGDNFKPLNGMPYEVKHIYAEVRFAEDYETHWGFKESRELDKRVSEYLTEHVKYKSKQPLNVPYLKDRYRVFSTFLNKIVNEIVAKFLIIPGEPGDPLTDKMVDDLTMEYQWLLKYDPIILNLPMEYFFVDPYANSELLTVTPRQLTFIKAVNRLYLKNKIIIEGHFEVSNNV